MHTHFNRHSVQSSYISVSQRERVEQMHSRLGPLFNIQVRVIVQTGQPIGDTKSLELIGPLSAPFAVTLVFFVDEVDYHPEAVGPYVSVGVIEIVG